MVFLICRVSDSRVCHLCKDNQSSLGPKWQPSLSPPNLIWRETHSWPVGFSHQYCCLWALPGPRNQSCVPWRHWKPLFHVASAAPDGDRSAEDSGERECSCQEWGAEAGSGKDSSIPCGLWERCWCCCGGCHGDVPQKINYCLERPEMRHLFFLIIVIFVLGCSVFPFTSLLFLELYSTCHLTHHVGKKQLAFNVFFCVCTGYSISLFCNSHLWNEK